MSNNDEEMPEAASSTNGESKPQASETKPSSSSARQDYKSSAQICEEMGIVNIEYNYTADDFANLVTYKLFNQHIRPLLLEKNPRLVMFKMVGVIGAKWREFIELKEKQQQQTAGSSPATGDEDKKEAADESVTSKGASSRRPATRRRTGTQQEVADEVDNATVAAIAEQADLDDQTTRRSARNKRVSPIFISTIHPQMLITYLIKGAANKSAINQEDLDTSTPPPAPAPAAAPAATNKRQSTGGAAVKQAGGPPKKRKKRGGDDDGGNADSDAEFEAMLEEQCRLEENEKEKKKQRQAAKKQAAAQAKAAQGTTQPYNYS